MEAVFRGIALFFGREYFKENYAVAFNINQKY